MNKPIDTSKVQDVVLLVIEEGPERKLEDVLDTNGDMPLTLGILASCLELLSSKSFMNTPESCLRTFKVLEKLLFAGFDLSNSDWSTVTCNMLSAALNSCNAIAQNVRMLQYGCLLCI